MAEPDLKIHRPELMGHAFFWGKERPDSGQPESCDTAFSVLVPVCLESQNCKGYKHFMFIFTMSYAVYFLEMSYLRVACLETKVSSIKT